MNGPAPKETKRRRNADTFTPAAAIEAEAVPAPKLRDSRKKLQATRDWWQTWASAPQAELFTSTDWSRLQMLSELVDRYFRLVALAREEPKQTGDPDLDAELARIHAQQTKPSQLVGMLAEIRQSESLLGATHVDRLKGRIKITRPDEGPAGGTPADVAQLDDYRGMFRESGG